MVKILLAIITSFSCLAHADVFYTGKSFDFLDIDKASGRLEISFGKINHLRAANSKISEIVAFRSEIQDMVLENLNVKSVDFSSAKLRNGVVRGSNLMKALFRDADLQGARFENSNISDCSFDRADLRGANLQSVIFFNCSFWDAIFNNETKLPFDPFSEVEKGMIYVP